MNDINQPASPANPTTGAGLARNVRSHRLSSPAIAILVIGSVLGAGAVGAVIGGASRTRTVPSNEIPLPDASELQPVPLNGSSLGEPGGRTSSLSLGSANSGASFNGQGYRGQSFASQPITERALAAQVTPTTKAVTQTTKLTTLTLAPRPRPGTATTIARTKATTIKPRVVTTTTTIPQETIATDVPVESTEIPVESTEPPVVIQTAPPRVPTTTRPQRQTQQQGHQLGSGIVVVPASGYSIAKKFDNGEVIIGNQFSYIHTWVEQAGDTSNLPATQVVDYISNKILPMEFQDVQASAASALKPAKTSISSMASAGYQAILSGQQGTTDIEGFSFSAVRPDGTVLLFFAVVKSGSFEEAQGPIGQMLGSILASM